MKNGQFHFPRSDSRGFTLLDCLMVVTVIGIFSAIAVPSTATAMRQYSLNNAAQMVGSAVRAARHTAISTNKTVRIRFNCPSKGAFRVVEVVGSGVDTAPDRCSETPYPYPDGNPDVAPDVDGPVLRLSSDIAFGTFQDAEIDPNGRVVPLTACPSCAPATGAVAVSLTNGTATRTLTITANGRIALN
jgi:prepilin-type N-terminal cleavage/methylation domain-containing protein